MLQGFFGQYRGVDPPHHYLHPLPAIGVADPVGSRRKFGHDGDTHQIHILIDVIGRKSFLDNGNRVAGRGKRRQHGKVYPLQFEGSG